MKRKLFRSAIFALLSISFCLAGGHVRPAYAHGDRESYQGVMKSIPHTVIQFDSGSATLTESNKTALRDMLSRVSAKNKGGQIAQITVAAWSDRDFPKNGVSLSDAERTLAKNRADAVAQYINQQREVVDVETYNMAEGSNWLSRTLQTSDAELKSIFSKKGAAAPVTHAEFRLIKNEGGPGDAVVVVQEAHPMNADE